MPIYKLSTPHPTVAVHFDQSTWNGSSLHREKVNGNTDAGHETFRENRGHNWDNAGFRASTSSTGREDEVDARKSFNRKETIIEREIREQLMREAELAALHGFISRTAAGENIIQNNNNNNNIFDFEKKTLPSDDHQNTSHQERKITVVRSPGGTSSTTTTTITTTTTTTNNASKPGKTDHYHGGESVIQNEMIQAKEREEELKRHRKELELRIEVKNLENGKREDWNRSTDAAWNKDAVDSGQDPPGFRGDSNNGSLESLLRNKNSETLERETSERRHSSGEPLKSPGTTTATTTQRNSHKVQPFEEVELIQSELYTQYVPQNETLIEREVRLAREKEEALRTARSLLSLCSRDSQSDEVHIEVVKPRMVESVDQSSQDNVMKKFAENRLRSELEKEKKREIDLLKEGKIILLSAQRAPDVYKQEVKVKTSPEHEELREFSKRRSVELTSSDLDTPPSAGWWNVREENRTHSNPMASFAYNDFTDGNERKGVTAVKVAMRRSPDVNGNRESVIRANTMAEAGQRIENEIAEHRKRESELREQQRRSRNFDASLENHVTNDHSGADDHSAHAHGSKQEVVVITSSDHVTNGRGEGVTQRQPVVVVEQSFFGQSSTGDSVDTGKPRRLALIDQWERGIIQSADIDSS